MIGGSPRGLGLRVWGVERFRFGFRVAGITCRVSWLGVQGFRV